MNACTPVRVLSTLALAGVLDALAPSLPPMHLERAPTAILLDRIAGGIRADVAVLTAEAVADLVARGVLDGATATPLARSHVGIAVRQGAPRPDISGKDQVVAALLAARSVAMSRAGASGIFMAGLLRRLGIADAVNARATIIPGGLTGERLLSGEADLAIQQVSELMDVPGIDIVGRLPPEIEGVSLFTAALFAGTSLDAVCGSAVLAALRGASALMRHKGLEPLDSLA